MKGDNPFSTCNRAFGDCLKVGAATGTYKDFETHWANKLMPSWGFASREGVFVRRKQIRDL